MALEVKTKPSNEYRRSLLSLALVVFVATLLVAIADIVWFCPLCVQEMVGMYAI